MASSSSNVPAKTHDPLNYYYSEPPFKWGTGSRRRRSARSSRQNKTPTGRLDYDVTIPTTQLPLPPPPGFSPRRDSPIRDTTPILTMLPPPQHRRQHSPRQDSPAASIDCSAKLSSFIHRSSSPEPFLLRDSESEARQQGSEGPKPYSEGSTEKQYGKTTKGEEADVSGSKRSSKLLIKIPSKKIKLAEEKLVEKKPANKKQEAKNPKEKKAVEKKPEEKKAVEEKEKGEETKDRGDIKAYDDKMEDEDEGEFRVEADKIDEEVEIDTEGEKNPRIEEKVRVWNMRHRNPSKGNKGEIKAPSSTKNANNKLEENKGKVGGGGEKKRQQKVKLSLNVALTKQEIEQDLFAWSGAKPPRRPQKREKNVQKILDSLFPGLSLTRISINSYKS